MSSEISIITPWLDHPEFIEDYERAVRGPGVEVIVVDNGSADATVPNLREMVGRLGGKYLRNEENRWFSAANNQGLAVATGRIVLFMNNDISAEAGWLDRVQQDVRAGGLFGPTLKHKSVEQWEIDYLEGWCIAGERAVWDTLGGWNDRAFRMPYWEDVELCWQASRAGLSIHEVAWPVKHKVNGTSDTISAIGFGIEQNRQKLLALLRGEEVATPLWNVEQTPAKLQPLEWYLQTGRLPDAEQDYRRAVEREPARADLRLAYGMVLACCGRQAAAIDTFRHAMKLDPNIEADAFREIGIVHDSVHQVEAAIQAFAEVVRRRPNSPVAYCNLAAALTRAGRPDQAVLAARAAVRLHAAFAPARAELAHALLKMNELHQAIQEAEAAVRLAPDNLTAWYVLGMANKALGRPQPALAAFDRALQLDPNNEACHIERQQLLSRATSNPSARSGAIDPHE